MQILKSSSSMMLGSAAAAVLALALGAMAAAARPAHQPQPQVSDRQSEGYMPALSAARQVHRSPRSPRTRGSAAVVRASVAAAGQGVAGVGETDLVREARRWLGSNPTRRSRLWCATFMNFVLERTGRRGSGSDLARSFASYGHRVSGPQVGAIAVMTRNGGGHVGVVTGVDSAGNPIIISGNYGHRVAEAVFPGRRVYAYVMP